MEGILSVAFLLLLHTHCLSGSLHNPSLPPSHGLGCEAWGDKDPARGRVGVCAPNRYLHEGHTWLCGQCQRMGVVDEDTVPRTDQTECARTVTDDTVPDSDGHREQCQRTQVNGDVAVPSTAKTKKNNDGIDTETTAVKDDDSDNTAPRTNNPKSAIPTSSIHTASSTTHGQTYSTSTTTTTTSTDSIPSDSTSSTSTSTSTNPRRAIPTSSVSCHTSVVSGLQCHFQNLYYNTREQEFAFVQDQDSEIKGISKIAELRKLLMLSSIAGHNAFSFHVTAVPRQAIAASAAAAKATRGRVKVPVVRELMVVFARFKPDNLHHVVHDDLMPLYFTMKSLCVEGPRCPPVALLFADHHSASPHLDLYHALTPHVLQTSELAATDLTWLRLRSAWVGVERNSVWYQYGFGQPQGPIETSMNGVKLQEFARFMRRKLGVAGSGDAGPSSGVGGAVLKAIDSRNIVLLTRRRTRKILNEKMLADAIFRELWGQEEKEEEKESHGEVKSLSLEDNATPEIIAEISDAFVHVGMHEVEKSKVGEENRSQHKRKPPKSRSPSTPGHGEAKMRSPINPGQEEAKTRSPTNPGHEEAETRPPTNPGHGEVKILSLEDNSIPEIIAEISNASVLVGMHGAALILGLFLPPSAILLEMWPFGIDPSAAPVYRAMCELEGSKIKYKAWENLDIGHTRMHPEYPSFHGGLGGLAMERRDQIRSGVVSGGKLMHVMCCDDPDWLFRVYQDTEIRLRSHGASDALGRPLKSVPFEDVFQKALEERKEGIQTLEAHKIEEIVHRGFLERDKETEYSLTEHQVEEGLGNGLRRDEEAFSTPSEQHIKLNKGLERDEADCSPEKCHVEDTSGRGTQETASNLVGPQAESTLRDSKDTQIEVSESKKKEVKAMEAIIPARVRDLHCYLRTLGSGVVLSVEWRHPWTTDVLECPGMTYEVVTEHGGVGTGQERVVTVEYVNEAKYVKFFASMVESVGVWVTCFCAGVEGVDRHVQCGLM